MASQRNGPEAANFRAGSNIGTSEPNNSKERGSAAQAPTYDIFRGRNGLEFGYQQRSALVDILDWIAHPLQQVFHLHGYAGVGKTELISCLPYILPKVSISFAAPTAKAALVLREKGCPQAMTIHAPPRVERVNGKTQFRFVLPKIDHLLADLLVIDEASMVPHDIGQKLLNSGTSILVVQDPFQLPPVSGNPFFNRNFSLSSPVSG
jgi:exodeoxyribonuclease-5